MALYGNGFYGLFKYGPDALIEFDARPFTAKSAPGFLKDGLVYPSKIADSTQVSTIRLSWSTPTGDWDLLHLVRNPLGLPVTPDDGSLLLSAEPGAAGNSYWDVGSTASPLVEGHYYYYGIFVRRTSDGKWFDAASVIGTVVKNYGTADLMYSYLPFIYRSLGLDAAGSPIAEVNSDLYNFISMFAFEYDAFKTDAENVKRRYDIANLNGRLIPALMNEFGFTYEAEMGIQQGRRLLQNAANIYLKRGSIDGLKTFASAFSGYNTYLGSVKNLMLTVEDSSFENTVGNWGTLVSGTISSVSGAGESPAVTPYLESTSPANYPNGTNGLLKAVGGSGTTKFGVGMDYPVTAGIPVVAGTAYTFSIYSRAKTTTRSVSLDISWYNSSGSLISDSGAHATTNSTSAWTRAYVTGTAPSNAVYAGISITITSAASGEIHYFDAAQFEASSSATNYVDARRIDIYMGANRINLAKNPSFASVTTNWAATGGTLSVNTMTSQVGTTALKVAASGTSAVVSQSESLISVVGGAPYALSAYAQGPATDSVVASVLYYDSSDTLISTATGTSVTLASGVWERVSVLSTAPSNATKAKIEFTYTTANTHLVYLDAVLFEVASYVQDYFDGSTGYYQTDDLLWENGDATNGRSLYYRNRTTVTKRLSTVLPDYLPLGAPYALFVGISVS